MMCAHQKSNQHPSYQKGVALVVALVLLLVVTIIGLAGIQGTNLQERMSANMYDRSLAFQRAEAGLRAAEEAITSDWQITALKGIDCSDTGAACLNVPQSTFIASNDENSDGTADWISVTANQNYDVNAGVTPGDPQYHIEFMGTGNAESNLGFEANADYGNYGNPYPPDDVAYYRVTTRSSNPGVTNERAIVALQTTVKRAY